MQVYFTGRRYYNDRDRSSNDRDRPSNDRDRPKGNRSIYQDRNRSIYQARDRPIYQGCNTLRCFVCNKEDCRLWKYTKEEQNDAIDEYKDFIQSRLQDRISKYTKQHIAEFEREPKDTS